MTDYRISIIVSGQDQGASAMLGNVQNSLGGLGKIAGGVLAGNLLTQVANGIASLGREALDSYAGFERLGMSLQSLSARELLSTGVAKSMDEAMNMAAGSAASLQKWVQKVAIESPFNQDDVAQAYRLSMAYGFTTKESQRLTQAMIDFSAGSGASGASMQMIALALGQIKAKGKLAGQEVLQLTNAGLNVRDILAKAFGKSTEEIVKMQEEGLIPADKAIQAIVKSLETDFGGAAKRQSQTFSGLISSLEDIKKVGLREFFASTFESIKPYLIEFVDLLSSEKSMQSLRTLGSTFGSVTGDIAKSILSITKAWTDLDPKTQESILKFAGLAMTVPIIIGLSNSIVGLIAGVSGLANMAGAAASAWKLGLSLTTSLQVGFGAAAVAAGALSLAIGSVVAVLYAYNEFVSKTQTQGMSNTQNAWASSFTEVQKSATSTTDVLSAYSNMVASVNQKHEEGGIIATLFVDKTEILRQGIQEAGKVAVTASRDYDDYRQTMVELAKTAGFQVDAEGRLIQVRREGQFAVRKIVDENYLLKRGAYEAAAGMDAESIRMRQMGGAAKEAAEGVATLQKVTMTAKDISKIYSDALKEAGVDSKQVDDMSRGLSVTLGEIGKEQASLENDVRLYSAAVAYGIIDQKQYNAAMEEAKNGTFSLDDATRQAISSQVNHAAAAKENAAAARDAAKGYWELAESLKNASQAEVAKAALQNLKQALDDGKITPAQYGEAYKNVGMAFGFVNERSIALAGAIPALNNLLLNGTIPASSMAEAIKMLSRDAQDGTVSMENIIKTFGVVPQKAQEAAQAIPAAAGAGIAAEMQTSTNTSVDSIKAGFNAQNWGEIGKKAGAGIASGMAGSVASVSAVAGNMANTINTVFGSVSWSATGEKITDGLAAGITAGKADVINAAVDVARSALKGANEELGIKSPSRKFMVSGRFVPAGLAKGILDNMQAPINAIREMASGIMNAGSDMLSRVTNNYNEQSTQFYAPYTVNVITNDPASEVVRMRL